MEHFKAFKKNVPVMGGILLDRSLGRVLLVKGWKNTACWGFPRGKIHKNETDVQCAVREVRRGQAKLVCRHSGCTTASAITQYSRTPPPLHAVRLTDMSPGGSDP